MKNPSYFFIGLAGGLALELLQLHIYQGRLDQAKYRKLFSAPLFWFCTCGLILGSGLVAWGLNADQNNQHIINIFFTGVAARSIVREILAAKNVTAPTTLGGSGITLKDIFS